MRTPARRAEGKSKFNLRLPERSCCRPFASVLASKGCGRPEFSTTHAMSAPLKGVSSHPKAFLFRAINEWNAFALDRRWWAVEYSYLGRSGLKIPLIGLGAWQFGSREWGWGREFSKEQALATLQRAFDLGMNLVDTAELYGGGLSEKIVGEAIKDRRDQVVVATKVSPWHLLPRSIRKAADRSLRRLGISEIDLYQIHFPNPLIPLGATMRAMERLIDEGKVRHLGVSNFGAQRLQRAQESLARHEVVSDQVHYSLLRRGPEKHLVPYAQKEHVTILAYSPLAQGILTGKYGPDRPVPGGVRAFNLYFSPQNRRRLSPLIETLRLLAEKQGKTPAQVALNWLLRQPQVVAIPGAKSPSQVQENAGSVGWRLTADDLDSIEEARRLFHTEYPLSTLNMLRRTLIPI